MYLFAFEKYGNENIKSSKIFSLFSDHDLDYLSWNILHSVINFWFFDRFTWRFNKFIWSGHQGKNCHVSFILREWLNLIEWVGNSNQGTYSPRRHFMGAAMLTRAERFWHARNARRSFVQNLYFYQHSHHPRCFKIQCFEHYDLKHISTKITCSQNAKILQNIRKQLFKKLLWKWPCKCAVLYENMKVGSRKL